VRPREDGVAGTALSEHPATPRWLEWAREIQALCQTGLAFATGYDRERYRRLTAIAAEMAAAHSHMNAGALERLFLAHPGYATPKVDVRAAVVRDNALLLVQERSDGRWAMPGGWADVGETPSQMVVRETREESGLEVVPRKVLGVFDANRGGRPLEFFHAYKIVFLCEITGGTPRAGDETSAVGFFPFTALPPLSEQRTNRRHIDEIVAHLADPSRPAAFD